MARASFLRKRCCRSPSLGAVTCDFGPSLHAFDQRRRLRLGSSLFLRRHHISRAAAGGFTHSHILESTSLLPMPCRQRLSDESGHMLRSGVDAGELGAVTQIALAQGRNDGCEVRLQDVKVGEQSVLVKLRARVARDDMPVVPVWLFPLALEKQGVAGTKRGFDEKFIHGSQYSPRNSACRCAEPPPATGR